jgi:hypothetical protein
MDFIDCLFVVNANDVDFEDANSYVDGYLSEGDFNVVKGLFNSLIQEDYINPYAYGDCIDEEVNLDVNGDDNEEINYCLKDLDV